MNLPLAARRSKDETLAFFHIANNTAVNSVSNFGLQIERCESAASGEIRRTLLLDEIDRASIEKSVFCLFYSTFLYSYFLHEADRLLPVGSAPAGSRLRVGDIERSHCIPINTS